MRSPRRVEPDSRKHITTITVSAPLFKYVLKKYLVDKYKYSRPEYLKDFYVASDLVCKIYLFKLIYRIKEEHFSPPGGYLRYRQKHPIVASREPSRHLYSDIDRHDSSCDEEFRGQGGRSHHICLHL